MNNRLQFRHHSKVFDTRDAAIEYIKNGIRTADTGLAADEKSYGFSLLAEPTVLLYKNEEEPYNPHMILAVGTYTNDQGQYSENRFCFIDVDNASADFEKYKEEIAALIKSITILAEDSDTLHLSTNKTESGTTLVGDVKIADSCIFDNVKKGNVIFSTENGLYTYVDVEFDKENNKISYQINGKTDDFVIPNNHLVSGEYKIEDESLHFKLSESAEEVVVNLEALLDEWDVEKNPTTPIVLKKETIGFGDETKAKNGHSVNSHLEPWQDILSADVVLSDNDYNILTKANSGKSLYVKGTADNIKYFKNGKEITVAEALDSCLDVSSDNENIIYKKEDGFVASVSMKYEKSENAIYFYKSNKEGKKEETKLALNSTNLQNSYYDPKTEQIVLQFITATGTLDTRYIDLSTIMDLEWDVKNDGHSVTLTKIRQEANKADILSADVKISESDDNILVEKDHSLYVKGTASNIKYGTTNVGDTLDTLKESDENLTNDVNKLSENVANKIDSIYAADKTINVDKSTKLSPEIKVNISNDSNNLIELKSDGINVYAKLSYDESNNKIKFSTTTGETEFQLQGLSFIDDARYDHQTEKIIITYHTNKGEQKTLEIDVRDLIKEWDVTTDTSGAIKLSQSEDATTGRHIISASTIVNTSHGDNMLVNDHGSLYVSPSKVNANAEAIEKLETRVTSVESSSDAATKKNDEQDTLISALRKDVDNEVALQEKHYEELSEKTSSNKQNIADNKQAIKDEQVRATAAEKENADDISDAVKSIESVKTDLANEISNRAAKDSEISEKVSANEKAIETEKDERVNAISEINSDIKTANAKIEAVSKTVDMLNGDASTVGSVREMIAHTKADVDAEIEAEATRAKNAEEKLQDEIDNLTSDAKEYTDAEIEKLSTKVSTDIANAKSEAIETSETKASDMDNQVRKHAEDLVSIEEKRATAVESAHSVSIKELQDSDAEIKADVAKKIENVKIVKDSQSDLQYILYVDDKKSGEINIPKDQFLKSVSYDEASKKIHFVFVTTDGEKSQDIDISHLVDVYTAGNGILLDGNKFSVVVNNDSEKYLSLSSEGLSINGIDSALSAKANVGDSYTKSESDAKYLTEHQDISNLATKDDVNSVSSKLEKTNANVEANTNAINVLNGNESTDGSVRKALADAKSYTDASIKENVEKVSDSAKAYTDEKVNSEKERALNIENNLSENVKKLTSAVDANTANIASNAANISSNAKDIKDLQAKVSADEAKIETLSDKVQDAATKITAEETRAKAAEVANETAIKTEQTRAENAESALSTSLNNEIQARKDADTILESAVKKATAEFIDSASISFAKTESTEKTSYTASVKIATGVNNIISNEKDGLHATIKLDYDEAKNTIWLSKDDGTKLSTPIQLNAGSIIDSITYDKDSKTLAINFTTAQGESRTVNVPVQDLFNEWDVDNSAQGSGIKLTKTASATESGVDLLSAKVLISPIENNIVKLDTNGLYVDGSQIDEIEENVECAQNEIDSIENVLGVVGSCDTPIEYHKTASSILSGATSFTDADAKLESAILSTNDVFHDTVTPSAYIKIEEHGSSKDIKAYVRSSNKEDNAIEIVSSGNDADDSNGLYLSKSWNCGVYEGGTEIDLDTYLNNFSN